MARTRLGLEQSKVQLRPLRRREPRDNSELLKKILLRKEFVGDFAKANIYLPACGVGVMYRQVWRRKAAYTLALDLDGAKVRRLKADFSEMDVRKADIESFSAWPPGVRFQIADFDVYGSPYAAIRNFLDGPAWIAPLYIVVTDGVPLWLGRGGRLPKELTGGRKLARVTGIERKTSYFDTLVLPWWMEITSQLGLTVTSVVSSWKKGRTVIYYAIKLQSAA